MAKIVHRIALYIRVSTEEQAENPDGSIRNQEERLRAAIRLKNMEGRFGEIAGAFVDRARSGKDTNRPELQRLLTAIRRKEITLVMVSELSRLSRSIKDFAEIWELMQACGCGFMSLRESFDTTTAAGEMVLYTMANIAQFERKQVSERVSANFQARAARGLYNGGVISLGYKRDPEKRGHLAIDEDQAKYVREAFNTFIMTRSIPATARKLNEKGYRYQRETEGGGYRPRLGYFTFQNLNEILRNKSYAGIRVFKVMDEVREAPAAWPAILDQATFLRSQAVLQKHYCRRKPESDRRFPFLLSGLTSCSSCNERLIGKSAHGNGGKVPYYEHSWSTKKQGCEVKKVFDCVPFRVQAKKLEPAVWEAIEEILRDPALARQIIDEATRLHARTTNTTESKRIKTKVAALKSQLEVLAERLAQLPATVSAEPVFRQMEKIEKAKTTEEGHLREIDAKTNHREPPATLDAFQSYLTALASKARQEIIQALVHRIEVQPEGFRLHLYAGQDQTNRGRKLAAPGSNNLIFGGTGESGETLFSSCIEIEKTVVVPTTRTNRPFKDPTFLHRKYVIEGLGIQEIAAQCFSSKQSLKKYLCLNGIPLRDEDRRPRGPLPFGQRWIKEKPVAHKAELEIIAEMKKLRTSGHSYNRIAHALNHKSTRTRFRKGQWYAKTVRQVLQRSTTVGNKSATALIARLSSERTD